MRGNSQARAFFRGAAALLILAMPALLWGQGLSQGQDFVAPAPAPPRGLQVYSVSAYAVYYSSGFPDTVTFQPGIGTFESDLGLGASTRIGWQRMGKESSFSFLYAPSYTGRVRYAAWNFLNQSLSLTGSRKLARKWTLDVSASGNLTNLAETFFSPTVFGSLASVPASFSDLAAAVLAGKFNNAQLAAILTGAPLIESPGHNFLYGERMLMASARTGLSYARSPRLTIALQAHGDRSQYISDSANRSVFQSAYLIPNTTSAGADLSASYSLSPRTQLGATVGASRIVSALQDSYITTSTGSVGRTMGRHWFLQVHGGVSVLSPVKQTIYYVLPSGPQPSGGGTLGFRTFSHTFLGSYDHTAGDAYGYGAVSTDSVNASWNWKRPGRSWWVECGLSQQRMQGNGSGYGNMSNWRVSGGWGRRMSAQTALLAQYVYMRYAGVLQNSPYAFDQSAVRVSVIWSPHPSLAR